MSTTTEPFLSAEAIADCLRTELTAREHQLIYLTPPYQGSSASQLQLQSLGLLEQATAATRHRATVAARLRVEMWGSSPELRPDLYPPYPGGVVPFPDANAGRFILFQEWVGDRSAEDVWGKAGELLREDPALLAATRAAWEQHFRAYMLGTALSTFEMEVNTPPDPKAPASENRIFENNGARGYAWLTCSDNTLRVFRRELELLNLTAQAWQAYYARYAAALRLNPANTESIIEQRLATIVEPLTKEEKLKKALMGQVQSTPGSLSVREVQQLSRVLAVADVLNEQHQNHGRSLSKVSVLVGEQAQTWYTLQVWWAGGDDAEGWYNVFTDEATARSNYAVFNNDTDPRFPATFTATLFLPDQEPKRVPGCILFQGKLAASSSVAGQLPRPYFLRAKMEAAGLSQSLLQAAADDRSAWAKPEMVACMFEPGDNGYGTRIEVEPYEVDFRTHNCWETGINYYELRTKDVPKGLFQRLQREASLFNHVEQIEEEGNWRGWCSTNREAIEQVCADYGWLARISG